MSRAQVFDMLQRQVANSGGCYDGGEGGLFSPQARAGQHAYQVFRQQNAGLSREEMKHAWAAHKRGGALVGGRMGGLRAGALMGGYPGQARDFNRLKAELKQQVFPSHQAYMDAYREAKQPYIDSYDMMHPGWKAARPPRGTKASHALLKQIKAAAKARPDCEVFGLNAVERANYNHLLKLAKHLGIAPAPSRHMTKSEKDAASLARLLAQGPIEV